MAQRKLPLPSRRAVIDIGTNSVKLLVAEVRDQSLTALWEGSRQTRLGRGFYAKKLLQKAAINETARAVADFTQECKRWAVYPPLVIATSAVREARNRPLLIRAIKERTALQTQVISGVQEAAWVFQGLTSHPAYRARAILVADVGGGSTEFVLGKDSVRRLALSCPIGSVGLLEHFPLSDPPTPEEFRRCREHIAQLLKGEVVPAFADACRSLTPLLIASGGSGSILAMNRLNLKTFNRERIESVILTRRWLSRRLRTLWALPLKSRAQLPGIPPNRADVILMGAAIYDGITKALGFDSFRVTTRGLRWAALLSRDLT